MLKLTKISRACWEREIIKESTAYLDMHGGEYVALSQGEKNTNSIKIDKDSMRLLGTRD